MRNGAAFPIPPALAAAARAEGRADWLDGLPTIVADAERAWSLTVGEPFHPGGHTAWVAPALTADGEERVLKIAWRHYEADHEADGLRAWSGNGAVSMYDSSEHAQTNVLLLERCRPGRALSDEPEERQDAVITDLLQHLWIEPPAKGRFRSLGQICEQWAQQCDAELAGGQIPLEQSLAREGVTVLRSLAASAEHSVLLCTDLHAGNVVSAQREPWLVIDPKPCAGDPAFDVVQHLLNCRARLRRDPAALVARVADLAHVDRDRVRLWLFARCVQESAGRPELADVAQQIRGL